MGFLNAFTQIRIQVLRVNWCLRSYSYQVLQNPIPPPIILWATAFNRTLKNMLRALPLRAKQKWPQQIQTLTFSHNATVYETTGYAPFHLMFGHVPRLPVDVVFKSVPRDHIVTDFGSYSKTLLSYLSEAAKIAQRHTDKEQEHHTHQYNKKAKGVSLQVGD